MGTCVPQGDDRGLEVVVLVTENAERRCVEKEMSRFAYGQVNPTRGQDASEMAMREERDVSVQLPKTGNESVRAVGNLRWCFTIWTAVAEEVPVRSRLANVRGALSFVVAVVPLHQVRFEFNCLTQAGQLTRSPRALSGAGQHAGERNLPQTPAKFLRRIFSARGQRNVGAAGVLAGERPFGFTVSNKVNACGHPGDRVSGCFQISQLIRWRDSRHWVTHPL